MIDTTQSIEDLGLKNDDMVIIQTENIKLVVLFKPSNKKVKLEIEPYSKSAEIISKVKQDFPKDLKSNFISFQTWF